MCRSHHISATEKGIYLFSCSRHKSRNAFSTTSETSFSKGTQNKPVYLTTLLQKSMVSLDKIDLYFDLTNVHFLVTSINIYLYKYLRHKYTNTNRNTQCRIKSCTGPKCFVSSWSWAIFGVSITNRNLNIHELEKARKNAMSIVETTTYTTIKSYHRSLEPFNPVNLYQNKPRHRLTLNQVT